MKLEDFDPKKISKGCLCIIIGKRRTGKTTLIKKLLKSLEQSSNVYIHTSHLLINEYTDTKAIVHSPIIDNICYENSIVVLEGYTLLERNEIRKIKDLRSNNTFIIVSNYPSNHCAELCPEYIFIFPCPRIDYRKKLHEFQECISNFDLSTFNDAMDIIKDTYNCLVIEKSTGHMYIYKN